MDYSTLSQIASHYGRAVRGDGFRMACPAHEGSNPTTLSVRLVPGKIVAHCFTGCEPSSVYTALEQATGIESINGRPDREYRRQQRVMAAIPPDTADPLERRMLELVEAIAASDDDLAAMRRADPEFYDWVETLCGNPPPRDRAVECRRWDDWVAQFRDDGRPGFPTEPMDPDWPIAQMFRWERDALPIPPPRQDHLPRWAQDVIQYAARG